MNATGGTSLIAPQIINPTEAPNRLQIPKKIKIASNILLSNQK